jgi:hypothetical protein
MEIINEDVEFLIKCEIMGRQPLQRDVLVETYGAHQLLIETFALLELLYIDKSIDRFLLEHMLHLRGMYMIFEESDVSGANSRTQKDPLFASLPQLPGAASTSMRIADAARQFWAFRKHPIPHNLSQKFEPNIDNTEKFDQAILNRIEDSLCLALTPTTFYIC